MIYFNPKNILPAITIALLCACSSNNVINNIENINTEVTTPNLAINLNTPELNNSELADNLIKWSLMAGTKGLNIKPNLDSIKVFFARNSTKSLGITTTWKTLHNNTTSSTAVNAFVIKNDKPLHSTTFTQTIIDGKIVKIGEVINLDNKNTRDIILDKFLSDNDLPPNVNTKNTKLIKPLSQFPISANFVLTEKTLTLIYNPHTLTSDEQTIILDIPYTQIAEVMLITLDKTANLISTEFNAPLP